MPVTRAMLQELAAPLNRGDFAAFARAVERLPSSERNVFAVLGAGELLRVVEKGRLLREHTRSDLLRWLAQYQHANVKAREP
jgi:hypothetical protein